MDAVRDFLWFCLLAAPSAKTNLGILRALVNRNWSSLRWGQQHEWEQWRWWRWRRDYHRRYNLGKLCCRNHHSKWQCVAHYQCAYNGKLTSKLLPMRSLKLSASAFFLHL